MIRNITLGNTRKIRKPVILNTLASFSNLIPFIALSKIVEILFEGAKLGEINIDSLWKYFGLMVVFFFVTFFFENLATKYTYELGYQGTAEGRLKLADHLRKLPIGFISGKSQEKISDTLMNDFFKVETAMTHHLPQFFSGMIVAVICSIVFLVMNVKMGLAALIGFPISYLFLKVMSNFQKNMDSKLSQTKLREQENIGEYLDAIKTLKTYRFIDEKLEAINQDMDSTKKMSIQKEGKIGSLNIISSMVLRAGLPLMCLTGSYLLLNGSLEIGTFLMFLFVGTRVYDPLDLALNNYSALQMASVSGERILKLLDSKPMSGKASLNEKNNIELKNVSFGYDDKEVLKDVSIKIKEKELTALVGSSGSGKSTLIKLISRFYDPNSGKVEIGGIDISEADPEKVLNKFSIVFQDVYLFKDTIYNNINFGKESASEEDVVRAAKLAGAYDFIMEKEEGFDTIVGEGGSTLSGGEKQRISIARAILKDAPIILLDEATSSLDPENEASIQKSIAYLIKNKTVIVIAHKLKTVIDADKIFVLEDGKIKEQGEHKDLLEHGGIYRKLWDYQEKSKDWQIAN